MASDEARKMARETARSREKAKAPAQRQAEVLHTDADGITWVHIPGGADATPCTASTAEVKPGDSVLVTIADGRATIVGNGSDPAPAGSRYRDDLAATRSAQESARGDIVKLDGTVAKQGEDIVKVSADLGEFGTVVAQKASVEDLEATNAEIENLKADKADIKTLEAEYAKIGALDANYAKIDLANVNNAWIENGTIKDAAIGDAQILGVSANKITTGELDASKVRVANLDATNIKTGKLTVGGVTVDVANNKASIDGSDVVDGTITLKGLARDVVDEIDGNIQTWTGAEVPTLVNEPASSWATDKARASHVGDVYYVVNAGKQADGYSYRFARDSDGSYGWALIKDSDVTAALQRLVEAEGSIDGLKTFESETSAWKTDTDEELSSLKERTTKVETGLGDKVSTSAFNEVKQTVDSNDATIAKFSQMEYTDADGNKVAGIDNIVNRVSQTANENSSTVKRLSSEKIGGRNLLLDSDADNRDASKTAYVKGTYGLSEALVAGEEYTVTARMTENYGCENLLVYINGGGTSLTKISTGAANLAHGSRVSTQATEQGANDHVDAQTVDWGVSTVEGPARLWASVRIRYKDGIVPTGYDNDYHFYLWLYLSYDDGGHDWPVAVEIDKSEISEQWRSFGGFVGVESGQKVEDIGVGLYGSKVPPVDIGSPSVYADRPGTFSATFTASGDAAYQGASHVMFSTRDFRDTGGAQDGSQSVLLDWVKLERGSRPTDWTPAPEDAEARLSSAETRISQNADAIELRATKADAENMKQAAIKAAADAIQSYVYSKGGGTHYEQTADGFSWTASNDFYSNIFISSGGWVKFGTMVTTRDSDIQEFAVYSGDGWNGGTYQNLAMRIMVKNAWDASYAADDSDHLDDPYAFAATVDLGAQNHGETPQVKVIAWSRKTYDLYVKFPWRYSSGYYTIVGRYASWEHYGSENGSVSDSASWLNDAHSQPVSYASTANTAETAEAAKTATNYMAFVAGTGLKVAPSEPASASTYSLMSTDGFDIVRDSVNLASFHSTTRIGPSTSGKVYLTLDGGSVKFAKDSESGSMSFGRGLSSEQALITNSRHLVYNADNTLYLHAGGIGEVYTGGQLSLESEADVYIAAGSNGTNRIDGKTAIQDSSFVRYYDASSSGNTLAAHSKDRFTVTGFGLPSGYSAVAVIAITTNHDVACKITGFNLDNSANPTVYVMLANTGDSSISRDLTINAQISAIRAA